MSRRAKGGLRFSWVGAILTLAFVGTAVSQGRVQVLDRHEIVALAQERSLDIVRRVDMARRGVILSADGQALAKNEEAFEFSLDLRRIPRTDAFYVDLASAAGVSATEIRAAVEAGRRRLTWQEPLGPEIARQVQQVKRNWLADGVSLARRPSRRYPLGEYAAGIVGLLRDNRPVTGLELSQERVLSGRDGLREGLVDRTGAFLPSRMGRQDRQAQHGQDLVLTIDSRLQEAAAQALRRAVTTNRASGGVAIVLDPPTGNILAMANYPTFDPDPRRNSGLIGVNQAVGARYEPGSTFKVITLAEAREAGAVPKNDSTVCTGEMTIGKRRIRCAWHNGTRAHGSVTLERAIAKSCNVAAARWAMRVGYEDMATLLQDLGLLERAGIGLTGEIKGEFNFEEYAKKLQIANVGFGQSVTATPLALAAAFNSIANDGLFVHPRLIDKVGGWPQGFRTGKRLFSPEVSEEIRKYMEAVVETDAGTGKTLRLEGYRLGGKTGTAQKVDPTTGKVGGGYISNFIGFVPADKPRAVILVMIDDPKAGQYYGATVAGPVFVEIAAKTVDVLQIPRDGT